MLACPGMPLEDVAGPLYAQEWDRRREGDEFAPSSGKVPILWCGDDTVVWDSLAIVDYLADRVGRDRFWPEDDSARAMARSMAAEMHSSYQNLRRQQRMNIHQIFPPEPPSAEVMAELARSMGLSAPSRARFGGGVECRAYIPA